MLVQTWWSTWASEIDLGLFGNLEKYGLHELTTKKMKMHLRSTTVCQIRRNTCYLLVLKFCFWRGRRPRLPIINTRYSILIKSPYGRNVCCRIFLVQVICRMLACFLCLPTLNTTKLTTLMHDKRTPCSDGGSPEKALPKDELICVENTCYIIGTPYIHHHQVWA